MHDNSTTPDISFCRINSVKDLWSHVVSSSYFSPGFKRLFFKWSWQSKINDFHINIINARIFSQWVDKHDIFRFKIPVNNFVLMQIIDCIDNLSQYLFFNIFFQFALWWRWRNVFFESSSFALLHYKIESITIFKDLVNFNDVWMIQNLEKLNLFFYHFFVMFSSCFFLFDYFDNSFCSTFQMRAAKYFAKTTLS